MSLQPRTASGGGVSREDQIANIAKDLETDMIPPWDEEKVKLVYPIDYNESMNTILGQEIAKYNKVVRVLNESLKELQLALRGMVVLSADLEAMGNSLFDQEVPAIWTKVAYPSLKPLIPWFNDFLARTAGFMQKWVEHGIPSTYWISGFFFPQGFLTAILQNYARKFQMPIDTVSFSYVFRDEAVEFFTEKPEAGAYTYGLFLEGSVWNKEKHSLDDPRPKELFSPMPVSPNLILLNSYLEIIVHILFFLLRLYTKFQSKIARPRRVEFIVVLYIKYSHAEGFFQRQATQLILFCGLKSLQTSQLAFGLPLLVKLMHKSNSVTTSTGSKEASQLFVRFVTDDSRRTLNQIGSSHWRLMLEQVAM